MFLGRVITKSKLVDTLDFVDITSEKKVSDDVQTYTLVIGKKLAEEIYGKENVHILDKRISENTYWTYARNEKHKEYNEGLDTFNSNIIKTLRKQIKYEFFNVLTEDLSKVKNFISFINGRYKKIIYVGHDHLYIFRKSNNVVYGISLNDIEYIGISPNKVIRKIQANPFNEVIKDNNFLSTKTKEYVGNDEKLIPYLYFMSKQ